MVRAPPSKSFMQRYVLLSSFMDGCISIHNPGFSDDDRVSMEIGKSCGKTIHQDRDRITLEGKFEKPKTLAVGESGTSFRLLHGLLASKRCKTEIICNPNLLRRPIDPLISSLKPYGYNYSSHENRVYVDASDFSCPGNIRIDPSLSSQFLSSLMFCMALSREENGIIEVQGKIASEGYVKITQSVLEKFGVLSLVGKIISINSSDIHIPEDVEIEGDYSSAAFPIVMGLLLSDDGITVTGLPERTVQPDREILEILKKYIKVEHHGDTVCVTSKKTEIGRISLDVDKNPDLAPPISILSLISEEGVEIRNVERLRAKESDRLRGIMEILKSIGCQWEYSSENLYIYRGKVNSVNEIPESADHRMVMTKFIASAFFKDRFQIQNSSSVSKSYPNFFRDAESIGFKIENKEKL